MILAIDPERLSAEQTANLIYSLIIDEAGPLVGKQEARRSLDEQLLGFIADPSSPAEPNRDTWGTGPDAQAGLEAMLELGV